MKPYSAHGVNKFVICCGYKGCKVEKYFTNYFLHISEFTVEMQNNQMEETQRKT
jgi:glucose-1-phosphate cytidylyltransferase